MTENEFTTPTALSPEGLSDHRQYSLWRDAFARLVANKLAVAGMMIVLVLFFIAIAGPYITPYDFLSQDLKARNQSPSTAHWLGTDDLGRDVLSRVIYGARTATIVAFSVTAVSLMIGIALGSVAGYAGGKTDSLIIWLAAL
jgi:peptide/nickel transport system permease protein